MVLYSNGYKLPDTMPPLDTTIYYVPLFLDTASYKDTTTLWYYTPTDTNYLTLCPPLDTTIYYVPLFLDTASYYVTTLSLILDTAI
jgi:hypothetical protein